MVANCDLRYFALFYQHFVQMSRFFLISYYIVKLGGVQCLRGADQMQIRLPVGRFSIDHILFMTQELDAYLTIDCKQIADSLRHFSFCDLHGINPSTLDVWFECVRLIVMENILNVNLTCCSSENLHIPLLYLSFYKISI